MKNFASCGTIRRVPRKKAGIQKKKGAFTLPQSGGGGRRKSRKVERGRNMPIRKSPPFLHGESQKRPYLREKRKGRFALPPISTGSKSGEEGVAGKRKKK